MSHSASSHHPWEGLPTVLWWLAVSLHLPKSRSSSHSHRKTIAPTLGRQLHQVTSLELASLKWNSVPCTADIVEHLPISRLTAMVVELSSHGSWPWVQERRISHPAFRNQVWASRSPELSSHLESAMTHKSTQVVAQMLKRPKECLLQQTNVVIYKLGISGNTQLIAFWTCVSLILMHYPTFINFKLNGVKGEHSSCTSHTSMHPRITHPLWAE